MVPFGLVNAPAAFQAYIKLALQAFIDIFILAYLDDILIFSKKEEDHIAHVQLVFEKLREYWLFVKLSKCVFGTSEMEFLGFIINCLGVKMNPSKLDVVATWPMPESFKDIQVFHGMANFYQQFIKSFSKIAIRLTNMLKSSDKDKFRSMVFKMTAKAILLFEKLKCYFSTAPMLVHFNPQRQLMLKTDSSGEALGGFLLQLIKKTGQWHLVAFWLRKMNIHKKKVLCKWARNTRNSWSMQALETLC